MGQQFAYGGFADAYLLLQFVLREGRACLHKSQYSRIVGGSELYHLPIVPPRVLVASGDEEVVVVHLRCHDSLKVTQEGGNVGDACARAVARGGADEQVRLVECLQIVLLEAAAHHYHRQSVARKDVVDHQACDAPVAVLERMDADIAIVEEGCQLDGREFACLFGGVVPIDEVGHEGGRLLGRGVVKTVAVAGDDRVGARLVLPRVYDVGGLQARGQLATGGVVLAQKGLVEGANEGLGERHITKGSLFGHHTEPDVACRHLLHVAHGGFADDLAEKQKDFGLTIGEGVALDVVAVVVVVNSEAAAKTLFVPVGEGLNVLPRLECLFESYLLHDAVMLNGYTRVTILLQKLCHNVQELRLRVYYMVVSESFFAEGFNGFDGEGTGGGEESGEQANEYQQDEGSYRHGETDLHGAEHLVVLQQEACQLHHADASHDAEDPRKEREEGALCQYLTDDDARACPEGAADANLFGALADRDQHDVADTDGTRDERADADQPDENGESEHQGLVGLELLLDVHRPRGALVVGRNGMELLQGGGEFGFDLCGGDSGLGSCHDHVDSLAEVIRLLEGCDGQDDLLVGVPADVYVRRGFAAHADNAILDTAHTEHTPRDIAALGEEFAINTVADDADFAALAEVDVIDIAPVEDGYVKDLGEVGGHTDDAIGTFAVAVADVVLPLAFDTDSRDDIGTRGFAAEDGKVAIDDVPLATFLQTFIGQARGGGADEDGVGGEPLDMRPNGGPERVAHRNQRQQNHHAPEDAEAREEAAGAVLGDGSPYFVEEVHWLFVEG